MDYYEVLGVGKDATTDQIKTAYRNLAKKYHPDVNKEPEAEKKFKEIAEAFEVLGDPKKRQEYDQFGNVSQGAGGFHDPFDLFGSFFHQHRNFRQGTPGQTVIIEKHLELRDILQDHKEEIEYEVETMCNHCDGVGGKMSYCANCHGRGMTILKQGIARIMQPCYSCRGTGKVLTERCKSCLGSGQGTSERKSINVLIPCGVEDNMRMSFRGKGGSGGNGSFNGDLHIVIKVKEHPLFKRSGTTLFIEMPVTYTQLLLGDSVAIRDLEGKLIEFKIPPLTSSHKRLKLEGKGLPVFRHADSRGALVVELQLAIPDKINDKYERAVKRLKKFEKENVPQRIKEFRKKYMPHY